MHLEVATTNYILPGKSISLIGIWMQKTAVSWVVYSLTHSKFMLGLSLFASMFPSFVFSFIGGVVSDRYNRYQVLLATQIASMIQAILLTLLVLSKNYNVWEVLALSFVSALSMRLMYLQGNRWLIKWLMIKNILPMRLH